MLAGGLVKRGRVCQGPMICRRGQSSEQSERLARGESSLTHHSELSEVMSADGGDSEAVLEHFAEAGVDTDTLAARLQVSPLSAGSQER